jgi:hypothetical protein
VRIDNQKRQGGECGWKIQKWNMTALAVQKVKVAALKGILLQFSRLREVAQQQIEETKGLSYSEFEGLRSNDCEEIGLFLSSLP